MLKYFFTSTLCYATLNLVGQLIPSFNLIRILKTAEIMPFPLLTSNVAVAHFYTKTKRQSSDTQSKFMNIYVNCIKLKADTTPR